MAVRVVYRFLSHSDDTFQVMESTDLTSVTTDRLEQTIQSGEAAIARIRSVQIAVLTELDHRR